MDHLIPAIIILISNLFSGDHNSRSYEIVTAIFGAFSAITFILIFIPIFSNIIPSKILIEIFGFSLITALARDYEKLIKKLIYLCTKKK